MSEAPPTEITLLRERAAAAEAREAALRTAVQREIDLCSRLSVGESYAVDGVPLLNTYGQIAERLKAALAKGGS